MKIGILTFHLGLNHGGYLQAYCMILALRDLGHEAEVINYKNKIHQVTDAFNPWVYRNPFKLLFSWKKNRAFQRAFRKMPMSDFTSNAEQVDWNKYDAILVGSDIVWNYELPSLGHDKVYFGGLPESYNGKLISYAPSCGQMQFDYSVPETVKRSMQRYTSTSARDANTKKFAQLHTGHSETPIVVDPTWLTSKDRGLSKLGIKNYILLYTYRIPEEYVPEIKKFAKERDLKIIGTGYYQSIADKQFSDADPFQWVDLFTNASYVIAGTFHAALYAIRESVKFAVISQPAINTKLEGPMNITGLHNHIIERAQDIESILEMEIDKGEVNAKIADSRKMSLDYLRDALA